MSDHTNLKQPTNICCFDGPLVTSKNLTSYLKLYVRYSSVKNDLWTITEEPDFSQTCCFWEKLKDH